MSRRDRWLDVLLYLLLVGGLSSIFYALVIAGGHIGGGGGAYVAGLMWMPGVSACLVTLLRRRDFRSLGFAWGGWRWGLLAYLLPFGYALLAYLAVWLSGYGGFPNPEALQSLATRLDWHLSSPALFVALYLLLLATTELPRGVAYALGEEIGWRGFLAPNLVANLGFTRGALLSGVIWAAWHMPILLFADYNSGTPWWVAMSCFSVMVIASSIVFTWVRLASASVWPCAILHASHNLFIQRFFTPLTTPHGDVTAYLVDEFGVALPLVTTLLAVVIWVRLKPLRAAPAPVAG